jgi:hypothetical protein
MSTASSILLNKLQRPFGCHRNREAGDRRKLEELASRKTRHPVVFSWQTQFAGAAHGILPCSHGEAGDRRKLEELLDFSTFWGMRCRRSWKEKKP